jgi:hypothetical protein
MDEESGNGHSNELPVPAFFDGVRMRAGVEAISNVEHRMSNIERGPVLAERPSQE